MTTGHKADQAEYISAIELKLKIEGEDEVEENGSTTSFIFESPKVKTALSRFASSDCDEADEEMHLMEDDEETEKNEELDDPSNELSLLNNVLFHDLNPSPTEEVVIGYSSPQPYSNTEDADANDLALIWKHVEEVIEDVIGVHSATVTEEEMKEARAKCKDAAYKRGGISLPFQYAGQSFNEQSQKLILNVMHYLKLHRTDTYLEERISSPLEKASRVLNVSTSVIRKLLRNWERGVMEQPAKKRKMKKRILDSVGETDETAIRVIIQEMFAAGETPYIPSILAAAKERLNFVGSRTSFRRILKRMGLAYAKVDKKLMLIDSNSTTSTFPIHPRSTGVQATTDQLRTKTKSKFRKKRTKLSTASSAVGNVDTGVNVVVEQELEGQVQDETEAYSGMPPLVPTQSTGTSIFLSNLDNSVIEQESNILPGEYIFEFDGENLCFRLITPEDLVDDAEELQNNQLQGELL